MATYDLWTRKDGKRTVRTAQYGVGKRWQARWRDSGDVQRKRNFATKDAADQFLSALRVTPEVRASSLTVADQYVSWIAAKGLVRESTLYDYRQKWRLNVEPTWGHVRLVDVKHSEVASWLGRLTLDKSATTARRSFMVLSGVLRQAVKDGALQADPSAGVDLPRQRKADVRALGMPEVQHLSELCAPYELVVWTLALTGMRFGEMAGLRLGDLDKKRRRLRVARTLSEVGGKLVESAPKNGRPRDVPAPAWLVDQFDTSRKMGEPLLPAPGGGVWRSGSWKRVWGPARAKAGLEGVRVHDLRHTAASLAIESGANVKAVQAMLGHQSAAMTLDLYAHWFGDGLDDVADRMGALVMQGVPAMCPDKI